MSLYQDGQQDQPCSCNPPLWIAPSPAAPATPSHSAFSPVGMAVSVPHRHLTGVCHQQVTAAEVGQGPWRHLVQPRCTGRAGSAWSDWSCVHSSPKCLQGWTSHCLSGPLLQCLATLVGKIKPPGEIPMTSPHVAPSPHHLWQLPFTSPPQLCSVGPSSGSPSSWTAPPHCPASPGASTAPHPAARPAGGHQACRGCRGLSGAVGCCQVLASSLCPVCLGAHAAGTWCEWARGRGERRGQQEQCWKWKRSDTSSRRNVSGTALNNGEIHSLQTATQSMSKTRPQCGDNRTITEKLEFGLLALSWGKSRQNNQRPSTSAESCGTSPCIHWSTRRWAGGRGGKEASGRAAHGVHDLISLISGWGFIPNWLQSWGLGHIPSALQLDYEGWPEVTGPHN